VYKVLIGSSAQGICVVILKSKLYINPIKSEFRYNFYFLWFAFIATHIDMYTKLWSQGHLWVSCFLLQSDIFVRFSVSCISKNLQPYTVYLGLFWWHILHLLLNFLAFAAYYLLHYKQRKFKFGIMNYLNREYIKGGECKRVLSTS